MAPGPTTLTHLPEEVLLERLLPLLALRELTALSATNRQLHALANDETLWLHKTVETFHLSSHTFAPPTAQSGWSKRLFQGLSRPRTFVWGSADNDRLGLPQNPRTVSYIRKVQSPRDISIQFAQKTPEGPQFGLLQDSLAAGGPWRPGAKGEPTGIVELQAGGWSFAARDMDGSVWVWGQIDGLRPGPRNNTWTERHSVVSKPTRIPLPCRAGQISVGRRHLLVLDQDNLIWELREWGKAYHHTAPALTSPTNKGANSVPHHIVQLSTGWNHSACLTSDGKIHAWHPFSEAYQAGITPNDQLNGPLRPSGESDRDLYWGTVGGDAILQLEPLPQRPILDGGMNAVEDEDIEQLGARRTRQAIDAEWTDWDNRASARSRAEQEKVVRISSGLDFVVALKGNGEVWYQRVKENEERSWEYLPFFSGPSITHLTAQYESITSYSPETSKVFHVRLPPTRPAGFGEAVQPEPLPSLQGQGVIQIALGDYHHAALTNKGEMWTWGQGNAGQLGLGIALDSVDEPRKVAFPESWNRDGETDATASEGDKAFVFNIAAAGWHTGALVLGDLQDRNGPFPLEEVPQPAAFEAGARSTAQRMDQPDVVPGAFPIAGLPFRVGFAGRGSVVGNAAQRHWQARAGRGTTPGGGSLQPQSGPWERRGPQ